MKYMDKDSKVYLVCETDYDLRYRIKPDSFPEKWMLYEIEFYTQDVEENGQLITFAYPW